MILSRAGTRAMRHAGGAAGYAFLGATAAGAPNLNAAAVTSAVNTAGADFIAVVASGLGLPVLGTLTDSKGNTWTARTAATYVSGYTYYTQIWYCEAPTVGSGHTFTLTPGSGGGIGMALSVAWFSHAVASPYDTEAAGGSAGGNATSFQDGAVTPSAANALLIAALEYNDTTSDATIDSGFTVAAVARPVSSTCLGAALGYLIQGAAASVNPTWSWSASANPAAVTTAVFKS